MNDVNAAVDSLLGETSAANDAPPAETGDSIEAQGSTQSAQVEESQDTKAFLAKANDEKRKRQEISQKYEKLQAEHDAVLRMFGQQRSSDDKQNSEGPSEEELSTEFFKNPVAFIRTTATKIAEERRASEFQERVRHDIAMFREESDDGLPDYPEMEAVFVEQSRSNPELQERLRNASRPAKFAYKWAKRFSDKQKAEVEKADKVKSLEAEVAELRAKLSGSASEHETITPQIPTSNVGAKSTGRASAAVRDDDPLAAAKAMVARRRGG